jgi:DNA polymerase-3 subunit beta
MFTTEKAALLGALVAIRDVARQKATIPILANALIEKRGDMLTVTGTNLNMEITSAFAADIAPDFQPFTCPASLLTEIVRNAPDGFNITIEAIALHGRFDSVRIRSGKSKTKLPVLPAADFPSMKSGDMPHEFSLNASTLSKALSGVAYAAETNEQRFSLCGVYLDPTEQGLVVVATNRLRLAQRLIRMVEFDQEELTFEPIIVPNDAISPIVKILDKQPDVKVELSDAKIRITAGATSLISKLVDGEYLPYEKLKPSATAIKLSFSAKALSDAVARVLTVSTDAMSGIAFSFADGRVSLQSRDDKNGESEDEVAAVGGAAVQTGFHGKDFLAALAHLEKDEAEFTVSDDRIPARLSAVGDTDVVMMLAPMRVKWAGFDATGAESEAA